MTNIARNRIAATAEEHLGEHSPVDTCMSLGMNKWPQELGLPGIGTNSVSEGERRARAGYNGWEYHTDMSKAEVGDFADWESKVLGPTREDANPRHVSVIRDIDPAGNLRTIGSGGPTGQVWWQPQGRGFNPPEYFRGFFRAPLSTGGSSKPRTKTSPTKQAGAATYKVKRGDYLLRIAAQHDTTVGRLVKLNKIRNPDHIEVGQVLKLR